MKQYLSIPIAQAGELWQYRFARHARTEHRHDELEFNLVLQGTATYLVRGRQFRLRRHSLVWLFPKQEHLLYGESPDFTMWIGVLKPATVQRTCTQPKSILLTDANPDGDYLRIIDGDRGVRLNGLLSDALAARGDVDMFNATLAYAMLTAWNAFLEAGTQQSASSIHPAVEAAARLLTQDPATDKIEAVALAAGLSQSRLRFLFKQQTGMTLTQYRSQLRIKRFQSLYESRSHEGMAHAAFDAGFGSYAQFHRIFKKVMGYGPIHYRRGLAREEE